ncbi:hypothetical protein [Micromonospora humi]|uniref:Uncharacterized protein n=1 Tax=Micromonospora humi TaxID=745366 RepID=A0A1C5IFF5_9ACTN|nr:hypothetical protein [Micromonospora humi]SCG57100.1 hypothetical protein GA0070213_105422 [Micromonospora humi]
MSSESLSPGEDSPQELLASVTALRRRARAARQAYWFPLLLFGLLTVTAGPLYVESTEPAALRAGPGTPALTGLGGHFLEQSAALGWYWLAALVGGYLLSLAWYRRHGRRAGVQTPTRAYVIAGIAGTLVGVALPVVLEFLLFNTAVGSSGATRWLVGPLLGTANRGMLPHLVIALGLAVLAHLERSGRLWIVVGLYTAALVAVNAWFQVADLQPGDLHRFSFMLAALLPAPVLLIGGGVALATTKQQHNGYA